MRQLRLTRLPAYDTTAKADAWQLLLSLPIPPDLPAFTHPAFSERGRRFILSVAQQYPGHSLPQLVQAGFEALVASARRYREQPERWERFGVWWVRQIVLEHFQEKIDNHAYIAAKSTFSVEPMNSSVTNPAQTFASLFEVSNLIFEIPAYQRAYSWGEEQIKQFLDDLREAQGSYYLGHYLFEQASDKSEEILLVIDGQQRITTCVIFFSVLCQELESRIESHHLDSAKLVAKWRATFVMDPNYYVLKLKTVQYDNFFFRKLLSADNSTVLRDYAKLDTNSQVNLRKCYLQFEKAVKAAETDELIRWGKLVSQATVTHLIVKEKKEAAQLFAFQNDRGKRLTDLEIVKSYLMLQILLFGQGKYAPEVVLPTIEDDFARIYKQMSKVKLPEDTVLTYFWRSTLTNPYGSDAVVDGIKKTLIGQETSKRVDWVIKFVDSLANAFEYIEEIEQEDQQAAQDLRDLDSMALSYPILLRAYRDGIMPSSKKRLFIFLENLTFRYKLRGGRADIYSRLNYHFFGETSMLSDKELNRAIDQFVGMLRTDGWGWYWNDHSMQEVLNGQFYRNPVDNYFLWKYERYLSSKDYPSAIPYKQVITQESIEHIAPQNPRELGNTIRETQGYGIYDDTIQPEEGIESGGWLNCLGNLMLLAQGQNSRVGNRPFAEKLQFFDQDKQLKQQIHLKDFLADNPKNPDEKLLLWDKAAIERRHEAMIQAAKEIWDLANILPLY